MAKKKKKKKEKELRLLYTQRIPACICSMHDPPDRSHPPVRWLRVHARSAAPARVLTSGLAFLRACPSQRTQSAPPLVRGPTLELDMASLISRAHGQPDSEPGGPTFPPTAWRPAEGGSWSSGRPRHSGKASLP